MPKSRAAASEPSISACGARSLPIASTTTLPVSWRPCFISSAGGDAPHQGAFEPSVLFLILRRLFDLHYFAAFVETALRAHAMRHARLLTIRTKLRLRHAQRIVRTAF